MKELVMGDKIVLKKVSVQDLLAEMSIWRIV